VTLFQVWIGVNRSDDRRLASTLSGSRGANSDRGLGKMRQFG
jgi:hypothetical protein